jgi:hypothetical protein
LKKKKTLPSKDPRFVEKKKCGITDYEYEGEKNHMNIRITSLKGKGINNEESWEGKVRWNFNQKVKRKKMERKNKKG